jgi:hypothetical protein
MATQQKQQTLSTLGAMFPQVQAQHLILIQTFQSEGAQTQASKIALVLMDIARMSRK